MDYYYSTSIVHNYSEAINYTSYVHVSTEDGPNLIKFAWYDVWQLGADPRTSRFPLMNGGPWTVLAILGLYLLFVRHYGPWLMKNRSPFDLRPLIFTYNALMMTINSYFFVMAAMYTRFGYDSWGCTPVDPQLEGDFLWQLKLIWFYFISKFVDLCETIFFILRKKNAQASTLHVVHHTLVPLDVWFGLKYSATTSAAFFPFINSFVHTIMYCYYGLSTLGPQWRPYLWWKKYLTQLQILQLALIAIHCLHLCLLPNCGIPKQIFAIYVPQAILLVYLFVSFFINTYFSTASSSKLKAS
ncbi:very long chain fatty acid elongase 7-like [Brevipalpus obovatus]|uniref:very long chain fatty acid elongase 7-like n=1 Tax=Brevipalpus obovatus TaxID=246614 RepID=UPI003D9E1CEF